MIHHSSLPNKDDLANKKFCGPTWAEAIQNCSLDTHCKSIEDCAKGETCHHWVPGCNVADMKNTVKNPSPPSPSAAPYNGNMNPHQGDHFYEHNFCGETYELAEQNCSSDTHCGETHLCPTGSFCLYVTTCSISKILSDSPTPAPIVADSPTESPIGYVSGVLFCTRSFVLLFNIKN